MKREEIEKAIDNGESVWAYDDLLHRVIPYKANEIAITGINTNMPAYELKDLFATKQQAEHYLHHANITRTEQLPFLTWEEFLEERYFGFYSIYNEWIDVYVTNGLEPNKLIITIENATKEEFINNYDLTEENFYNAYDECVKLFKQE